MTKEDFWTHKIKAFLSTSPVISLFPDNKDQAREFIATALDLPPNVINLDLFTDVRAIAKGFDIPPFVENITCSSEMFRQDPIFKHPLSGEEIKPDLDISRIDTAQTNLLIKNSILEIRKEIEGQRASNKLPEGDFYQRLYLALWRKLPDVIRQNETGDAKIGKYWDWLPADPRIPTHSVWEHSSIVSAIAGTNLNPSLLIFTIASPQQFISTARRTQDSWMGSFFYSFLMWEAIKSIAGQFGPDCFLFPDLRRQPLVDKWLETEMRISGLPEYEKPAFQIANFPNILTAIVPFDKAEEIAVKAHKAMQRKWREIVGVIKGKVEIPVQDKLRINLEDNWDQTWIRQTEEFLDQGVYWVACPWKDDDKNIMEVYQQLFSSEVEDDDKARKKENRVENLKDLLEFTESQGCSINTGLTYQCISSLASRGLTARKNLRDFYHQAEIGDRCTLCGSREALHPAKKELERRFSSSAKNKDNDNFVPFYLLRRFWQKLGEQYNFKGRIKRGDRLCAVCLVKRMALDFYFDREHANGFKLDQKFPSTSSIATAPFKARVIDHCETNNRDLLNNYVTHTQKFLEQLDLDYKSAAVPELKQKVCSISDLTHRDLVQKFLQLDGQWLFEDSFSGAEVEERMKDELEDLRSKAKAALKNLLDGINFKPSGYYAVISMDGDKIGDWLGGKKSPRLLSLLHPQIARQLSLDSSFTDILAMKRPLGVISHLSISIALKNFALEVAPRIIESSGHYGKLLYAGGDDLMAFAPVESLLEIISEIKTFFQGETSSLNDNFASVSGVIKIRDAVQPERHCLVAGNSQGTDDRLTASIGAAIIHRSYPLPQAIEEAFARALKENAKERLERNAVAIHLHKRAGSPLETGFKWNKSSSPDEKSIADYLQEIVGYFKTGQLSSRFGYTLKNWEMGLEGKWEDLASLTEYPWWHEAQKNSLLQLLERNSAQESVKKSLINLFEAVFKSYLEVFEEIKEKEGDASGAFEEAVKKMNEKGIDTGWNTVTELLILARFLAGEDTGE